MKNISPWQAWREVWMSEGQTSAGLAAPDSPVPMFTPKSTLERLMQRERKEIETTNADQLTFTRSLTEKRVKLKTQVDDDLAVLKKGSKLLKIPHRGQPKQTTFYVTTNDGGNFICYWSSKTKSRAQCTFLLKQCGLYLGQGQGLFKKRNLTMEPSDSVSAHSRLSFSLVTESRTVDMMALDGDSFEQWLRVFKHCGVEMRTTE